MLIHHYIPCCSRYRPYSPIPQCESSFSINFEYKLGGWDPVIPGSRWSHAVGARTADTGTLKRLWRSSTNWTWRVRGWARSRSRDFSASTRRTGRGQGWRGGRGRGRGCGHCSTSRTRPSLPSAWRASRYFSSASRCCAFASRATGSNRGTTTTIFVLTPCSFTWSTRATRGSPSRSPFDAWYVALRLDWVWQILNIVIKRKYWKVIFRGDGSFDWTKFWWIGENGFCASFLCHFTCP